MTMMTPYGVIGWERVNPLTPEHIYRIRIIFLRQTYHITIPTSFIMASFNTATPSTILLPPGPTQDSTIAKAIVNTIIPRMLVPLRLPTENFQTSRVLLAQERLKDWVISSAAEHESLNVALYSSLTHLIHSVTFSELYWVADCVCMSVCECACMCVCMCEWGGLRNAGKSFVLIDREPGCLGT